MDKLLIWNLLLSFLVGGLWIAGAARVAELCGPRLGGFLAGLPSTSVAAFLFIGISDGTPRVAEAAALFPLPFSVNALFLGAFVLASRRSLAGGLAAALLTWLGAEALIVLWAPRDSGLALGVWLAVVAGTTALVIFRKRPFVPPSRVRPGFGELLLRAALSGLVVAGAVLASRAGGAVFGAIFAAFPAVYTMTLLLTGRSSGTAFARAAVMPLLLSGLLNCGVFALVLAETALPLGLAGGLAVAWAASLLAAALSYSLLSKRL